MTVKQILTKYYEGESGDDKPTGVISGSVFRETDTRRIWITYDGDNWVVADKRVRLVNEDGTYVDLPGEFATLETSLTEIVDNIAVLEHHDHSRSRVYPQDVGAVITLVADAVADTFGDWTEIIPINTVGFAYEVVGLVIEALNAATTCLIQLGFSIADGSDPTTAQILGERRVLLPTPIARATEVLEVFSQNIPANGKLWGRMKTASVAADEAEISVVVLRHKEITNPIAMLTTWPWLT